ncbi:radical SAM protein [Paenibacillus sp. FSL M7-0896]|uniref:radical SAM protein n=1 Tax=Paenibacillus sp. FSL M7-0896 TaxID=2921610 RepID=UPI0030D87363
MLLAERFSTENGSNYIYDGLTGSVIPVNKVMDKAIDLLKYQNDKETIEQLSEEYGRYEAISAVKFISRWSSVFKGFYKNTDKQETKQIRAKVDEIEKSLSNDTYLMVLNLTENCNFRCKYCYLTETYDYTRNRTGKSMDLETGKKAIDFFFEGLREVVKKIPNKKAGITFYGGEPLLNFALIKELIVYAEENSPVPLMYNMTSNGSLLNDEIIDFVVKYDINLAISLDGSNKNHDKNRVSLGQNPTYNNVYENLKKFTDKYPDYSKLGIMGVYDITTDLQENTEYFEEEKLPHILMLNRVSNKNTDYYNQFSAKDYENYNNQIMQLRDQYIIKKQNNEEMSNYLEMLFDMQLGPFLMRRRANDVRPSFMPYTNSCVPGMRIFVRVDGTIDMCERINETFPIGHIDKGLDLKSIENVINEYNDRMCTKCDGCSVEKTCPLCFASCNENSNFNYPEENFCSRWKEECKGALSVIYTVLEKNENAYDRYWKQVEDSFEFRA